MNAVGSLLLFALVATVSPGGATTLATISGANFGFRRSLPLIAGIAAGLASMAALAGFGLAGLLLAFPSLALGMKLLGSAYLLWLAWQTARRGAPRLNGSAKPNGFIAGAWMLWHNPKGWAMMTGAAAAFVALASSPAQLGAVLGAVFGVFALASLSVWCAVGLVLARAIRSDRQRPTVAHSQRIARLPSGALRGRCLALTVEERGRLAFPLVAEWSAPSTKRRDASARHPWRTSRGGSERQIETTRRSLGGG